MQTELGTLAPGEASELAAEAYIFLYPLVAVESLHQAWIEKHNTFARLTPVLVKSLDGPPLRLAQTHVIGAWLDLSAGPVMVSMPDMGGRHYTGTAFDAWGEVVAAFGRRTDGVGGTRHVFAGPVLHDELAQLQDLTPTRVATNRVWISICIVGRSEGDVDALRMLAAGCRITPLGGSSTTIHVAPRLGSGASPALRVVSMTEEQFFNAATLLLTQNPVRRTDIDALGALHKLGLEPGAHFSLGAYKPAVAQLIQEGVALGRATVLAERERLDRRSRENWGPFAPSQDFPRDYVSRAARSHIAPHLPCSEDYLSFCTSRDSIGEFLHSSRRYQLRFEAADLPPTNAVWSLTAIDLAGRPLVRKPARSIGNHRELHFEPDGSLDIYIDSTRSRRGAGDPNWLQCPQGRFTLALELFAPRSEALQGYWLPPLVERQRERASRSNASQGAISSIMSSGPSPHAPRLGSFI